jgi:hypothetical protein
MAVNEAHCPKVATRYHNARLLHQSVEAVIEYDCIHHSRRARAVTHFARFDRSERERVVADDMLACFYRGHHD